MGLFDLVLHQAQACVLPKTIAGVYKTELPNMEIWNVEWMSSNKIQEME